MTARRPKSGAHIDRAALAVFPALLHQWLPSGHWRFDQYLALNPLREDRHIGSFEIDSRTGRWADHAVSRHGRGPISLYAYLFMGGRYREARDVLARDPLVRAAMVSGAAAKPAKAARIATDIDAAAEAKIAIATRTYESATSLAGTAAERYLLSRGLRPTKAWEGLRASVLRYPGRGRHPALVAPITSPEGTLVGIHRTYLQEDGAKLDANPAKLALGRVRGCAIRLGKPRHKLIVCEGLEDGLTLYQELRGQPVWVAGGASFLPAMRLPESVQELIIAADNDRAGAAAAVEAVAALARGRRRTAIIWPGDAFKDFNDELRDLRR